MSRVTRFLLPLFVATALLLGLDAISSGNEALTQSRAYCCNLGACSNPSLNLDCDTYVSVDVKPDNCPGNENHSCRQCVDWTVSGCLCWQQGSLYCMDNGEKYYGTQVACPKEETKRVSGGSFGESHSYWLNQNYPNPFNPSTRISYEVAKDGHVKIVVYDRLGKEVVTLVNEHRPSGKHFTEWDGRDAQGLQVASGLYFYRMWSGFFTATKRMLYVR